VRPIDPGGAGTLGDHAEGARDLRRAREAGGEKQTMSRRAAVFFVSRKKIRRGKCRKIDNFEAPKLGLMEASKIETSKTETRTLDLESEFVSDVVEGIEDFIAGRGKSFDNRDDLLSYLKRL